MKRIVCLFPCLAFVILAMVVTGCGGVRIIPVGAKVQNADKKFDKAEARRITADKDTEREKWR